MGFPDWLETLLTEANGMVEDLLNLLMGNGATGEGLSWGVAIVVLVLVALVAFLVWRVGLPRWRRVDTPNATVEVDQTIDPAVYRDAADQAAARADYHTAIRERFRAIIRELEYRTIIAPRPSRTAFEAAGVTARELPAAREPMYRAAGIFSDVMYGDQLGTPAGWQEMLAAEAAVHAAADHPSGVPS